MYDHKHFSKDLFNSKSSTAGWIKPLLRSVYMYHVRLAICKVNFWESFIKQPT